MAALQSRSGHAPSYLPALHSLYRTSKKVLDSASQPARHTAASHSHLHVSASYPMHCTRPDVLAGIYRDNCGAMTSIRVRYPSTSRYGPIIDTACTGDIPKSPRVALPPPTANPAGKVPATKNPRVLRVWQIIANYANPYAHSPRVPAWRMADRSSFNPLFSRKNWLASFGRCLVGVRTSKGDEASQMVYKACKNPLLFDTALRRKKPISPSLYPTLLT